MTSTTQRQGYVTARRISKRNSKGGNVLRVKWAGCGCHGAEIAVAKILFLFAGLQVFLYFPIFPISLRSSCIFLYFHQIPRLSYNFMLVNRINTKMHHFQYEISKFSRGWYPRTPIVTIIDEVKVFQARCSTKTIAAYDVKKADWSLLA